MELFDIIDENGLPTGRTEERNLVHELGLLHRTVHIWISRIYDGKRQVLLQKRSLEKDSFPGRFDTSSSGHITAGDEPLPAALRELSEELGIFAEKDELSFAGTFRIQYEKEFHGKMFRDNEIANVYVYTKDLDIRDVKIQEEELSCVQWFDIDEVLKGIEEKDEKFCVPSGGLLTAKAFLDENFPLN